MKDDYKKDFAKICEIVKSQLDDAVKEIENLSVSKMREQCEFMASFAVILKKRELQIKEEEQNRKILFRRCKMVK